MSQSKVWNSNKVSLRDVMNEEIASKLSYEEEMDEDLKIALELSKQEEVTEFDQFDADLQLAIKLSQAENANNVEPFSPTPSASIVDEDFLLALKLQNDADNERYARHLLERERLQSDNSKVAVSYDIFYRDNEIGHEYYRDLYDTYEDYESDDEEDEEEFENEERAAPQKPHHETVKNDGRLAKKEIITKHDPIIAAAKNAHLIERTMDSGNLQDLTISTHVYNSLKKEVNRGEVHKTKVRGNKLDKATNEQVMDQRTRTMVFKMLNSGVLSTIHGIINTGKEANVYHAYGGKEAMEGEYDGKELAIKIFKTTLNEFKNRTNYVEGEYRFRHRKLNNPRKLIKLWAEKETRNLKRLQAHGVPCPFPILLKENVLVMSFIGENGIPAPLLRNMELSQSKLKDAYLELAKLMRQMYQKCRLVHADLSEYNILYHQGHVVIIDVSQAVEDNHPRAMEFLKKDCTCVTSFFQKQGEGIALEVRPLFDFVVNPNIQEDHVDDYLNSALAADKNSNTSEEDKIQEQVFLSSFTPRNLHQVADPSKELFEGEEGFHNAVTGFRSGQFDSP